jgi:DNA polymerase III subunit beta
MQFQVENQIFLDALARVCGLAGKCKTLPIAEHILFEVSEGKVALTTTDVETSISVSFEADGSPGSATAPAKKVYDIARSFAGDVMIHCAIEKNAMGITAGSSKFRLNSLNTIDFPAISSIEAAAEISLPSESLFRLIDSTLFAIAPSHHQACLTAGRLERRNGTVRMVGTDGHRLALSEISVDEGGADLDCLIPRPVLLDLKRAFKGVGGSIRLAINDSRAQFAAGDIVLKSALVGGRYPDYESVLPKPVDYPVTFSLPDLVAVVSRVRTLLDEKTNGVRLQMEDSCLNLSSLHKVDHVDDSIDALESGSKLRVSANALYLLDALHALPGETVALHPPPPGQPSALLLTCPEGSGARTLQVVMPMKD